MFGFTISRVKGGSVWVVYRVREKEILPIVSVLNKWTGT